MSDFFDQAFWQQLVSNVLSGLFTGLVVGVVIWLAQLKSESRQETRKVKREVATAWEEVLDSVQQPDTFNIMSASGSVPLPASAVSKVISTKPLAYWDDLVKKSAEVSILIDFSRAYRKFTTQAAQLDDKVSRVVRSHNAKRGAIDANDPPLHSYFIGRSAGFNDEELAPYVSFSGNNIPQWVIDGYKEIQGNPEVLVDLQEYQAARKELLKVIKKIKQKASN